MTDTWNPLRSLPRSHTATLNTVMWTASVPRHTDTHSRASNSCYSTTQPSLLSSLAAAGGAGQRSEQVLRVHPPRNR